MQRNLVITELEARENAALEKASKEKSVKEQQTKNAAKELQQEVMIVYVLICFLVFYKWHCV